MSALRRFSAIYLKRHLFSVIRKTKHRKLNGKVSGCLGVLLSFMGSAFKTLSILASASSIAIPSSLIYIIFVRVTEITGVIIM